MTSNSPLNHHVLLQFKNGLREQQRELQQSVDKADKEIRVMVDSGPCDSVDVSCFSSSKESMFARSSQIRSHLRLVELALDRIRSGSFGTCAACESAIGLKRLQAVPWASRCIQCQEQSEHGSVDESVNSLTSGPGGPLQHSTV